MTWLDAIGWLGSALLVYSVMQARVLRFRVLNLAACVVLTGYNAALEIWPMVAMNVALLAINTWHLRALLHTRHDSDTYVVLEVGLGDSYLRHVLAVHAVDIAAFQPDLLPLREYGEDVRAFVIQRGDETVGVVLVRMIDTEAHVLLDYVTPRYRDFSPGQFVWKHSDVLSAQGINAVVTSPTMIGAYYAKIGFALRPDGAYQLKLPPVSPQQR